MSPRSASAAKGRCSRWLSSRRWSSRQAEVGKDLVSDLVWGYELDEPPRGREKARSLRRQHPARMPRRRTECWRSRFCDVAVLRRRGGAHRSSRDLGRRDVAHAQRRRLQGGQLCPLGASARRRREVCCDRRGRRSEARRIPGRAQPPRQDREADRVRSRMAGDWQETVSKRRCRPEPSRNLALGCRLWPCPLPAPRDIHCPRFATPQRPKTLVRRVPNHGLQPEANRVRVRPCARREFRLSEEPIVDIQCLLHPYVFTILIWMLRLLRELLAAGDSLKQSRFGSPSDGTFSSSPVADPRPYSLEIVNAPRTPKTHHPCVDCAPSGIE